MKDCTCCNRLIDEVDNFHSVCFYCMAICGRVETCSKNDEVCGAIIPIEDNEIKCEKTNCYGYHKGEECFGADENGEIWVTVDWTNKEGLEEKINEMRNNQDV